MGRCAMHVVLVVAGGLGQLGLFVLFGWLWGASPAAMALAARAFIPVWLLVACTNMWIGVRHMGYSAREETLILLVVFLFPAALAMGLAVWIGRQG